MLDDFGHEMDHTHSKMENTLSKMAKVLHLSNGEYMNHKVQSGRKSHEWKVVKFISQYHF